MDVDAEFLLEKAKMEARTGFRYYVETIPWKGEPGASFTGMLMSKKVRLRTTEYWLFSDRNLHTLVKEEDIVDLKRVLSFV